MIAHRFWFGFPRKLPKDGFHGSAPSLSPSLRLEARLGWGCRGIRNTFLGPTRLLKTIFESFPICNLSLPAQESSAHSRSGRLGREGSGAAPFGAVERSCRRRPSPPHIEHQEIHPSRGAAHDRAVRRLREKRPSICGARGSNHSRACGAEHPLSMCSTFTGRHTPLPLPKEAQARSCRRQSCKCTCVSRIQTYAPHIHLRIQHTRTYIPATHRMQPPHECVPTGSRTCNHTHTKHSEPSEGDRGGRWGRPETGRGDRISSKTPLHSQQMQTLKSGKKKKVSKWPPDAPPPMTPAPAVSPVQVVRIPAP